MCRNVLIRFQDVGQQLYQKETPAQLSSCEFCETFKKTFFTDHLWTTASVLYYNALYISNISYLYSVNISPRYKKDSQSRSRSRESFFLWSFRRAVKIAIAFFDLFNSKQLLMLRSQHFFLIGKFSIRFFFFAFYLLFVSSLVKYSCIHIIITVSFSTLTLQFT